MQLLTCRKETSKHASRLRRFKKYLAPLWQKQKTNQPINWTIWLKLSRNRIFCQERKPLWHLRILLMNSLRNNGSCLVESCNNSAIQIFQSYNTWAPALVTSSYCCVCWRRWRWQVLMSDGKNSVLHPSLVWLLWVDKIKMGSWQHRDLLHFSYREVWPQADISGNQQPFEKAV